jgi:two-component system osmolarity sensor histidine kinase EnvZ
LCRTAPTDGRPRARHAAADRHPSWRDGPVGFSLFWRTFFLLAILLAGGVFAWVQTLRALEFEPRAVQAAQQTAGLVNLSRAALRRPTASTAWRWSRAWARKRPSASPRVNPVTAGSPSRWTASRAAWVKNCAPRWARTPLVARSVNGRPVCGWAFPSTATTIGCRPKPATASPAVQHLGHLDGHCAAGHGGGLGGHCQPHQPAAAPAEFAASRIREGNLNSQLDENTLTSEVREVNRGFNRMARELARVEEDRAVMLAGISHDLRTPLARLRLETEMSVEDDEAKRNMALDIDQLDAIIDKFMDYARPGETQLHPVHVAQLIDHEAALFRDPTQIRITSRVAIDLEVMADETELGRVFLNLFENARRYGRGTYTGMADVTISHVKTGPWAIISVRDHGPGVAPKSCRS